MSHATEPVEVVVSRDGKTCHVVCPYCGGRRYHGLGDAGDTHGRRVPHCSDSGYHLTPAGDRRAEVEPIPNKVQRSTRRDWTG